MSPQRGQGIIALNDTEPDLGGFQCAPELFREFEQWRARQSPDRDPYRPTGGLAEIPVVRPELRAGDLLIWNGMLAHGVAPNTSDNGVRVVQYVAMAPSLETHTGLTRSRVESWRHLKTPEWNSTLLGDAVRHESERYPPPRSTIWARHLTAVATSMACDRISLVSVAGSRGFWSANGYRVCPGVPLTPDYGQDAVYMSTVVR